MKNGVGGDMTSVKLFVLRFILVVLAITIGRHVAAAELKYSCLSSDPIGNSSQGTPDWDKLYPIASVSKVMTSYWALSKMGPEGRFETRVHVRLVDEVQKLYDLHFEGSRDPYSDQSMFQFVIGQLNQKGIFAVRELTFDQNFKFRRDLRGKIAQAYLENTDPGPKTVHFQLKTMMAALNADYSFTRVKAKAYFGIQLPIELKLKAESISFVLKEKFAKEEFESVYTHKSAPLWMYLKEMNRNSNNHAATQIFESLGGAEKFKAFIEEKLQLSDEDLVFYNGSGNRLDLSPARSVYNLATCRAVMKVTQALKLESDRAGIGIEKILSVAGRAEQGIDAGTIAMFTNEKTSGVLIGKTGTVGPAVTFGGLLITDQGPKYYMYIVSTQQDLEDWQRAREMIRDQVFDLAEQSMPGEPVQFIPKNFSVFDRDSVLQAL